MRIPQKESGPLKNSASLFFGIALLAGLYFTINVNYLLFHSLAELFSIVIGYSLFVITWNSRQYIKNPYLILIGTAYFFIASLDTLHTLSYKGMSVFTDYSYYANQLWIAARYLESLTLFSALLFLKHFKSINSIIIFLIYTVVTAVLVIFIFTLKIFPICFIEDVGQTQFKIISEYIIIAILLGCFFLLLKRKNEFGPSVFVFLLWSIIFTILSELSFTLYISNYGLSNVAGHYFKIFSFFLIYKAIIQTGIINPYQLIFRELENTNGTLQEKIVQEEKNSAERDKLVAELTEALARVKTLNRLLPICANCKKIRDDSGYWNQIEAYISEHSDAEFSHSLCPDCIEKLYPGLVDTEEET